MNISCLISAVVIITSHRTGIFVAQVYERLRVINSEGGNQTMVIQNYCLGNSSVTHDIAKMDNYSLHVYRRLGSKFIYVINFKSARIYFDFNRLFGKESHSYQPCTL